MPNSVDQRIVNMKFDNSQFETGVNQTVKTIDKLNEKLRFRTAKKGFKDVEESANNVKFGGLVTAIETISDRFSSMGIVGLTVLQNITNSAVNAGKRIVSAFSLDPVKTGFQEYETQINAVQTILANTQSKGTNLQQVNSALDELNHYADMTIYNFTEMTRNIGTFTAAGVDLDTSVSAIKGIANLAAVSGSNSQQASTAMYQLSQALAAGTVKLMDWNSVVNAGMGGQVFQDALKETARVHNIKIDEMIKKEGSFRETLQHGWLSSEILTETLAKFTGDLSEEQLRSIGYTNEQITSIMQMGKTANDAATKVKTFTQLMDTLKEAAQSGWTQSWEIIIGDFEEAKAFLTEISDTFSEIINNSSDARNTVLQGWKDLGGRTDLIDSLRNIFSGLQSMVKPISEAFSEIIPPVTAETLHKFTANLKELTSHLTISDDVADKLKRTFKGLFSIFDILRHVVMEVGSIIGEFIPEISGLSSGFLDVTSSIGDFLVSLDDSVKSSGVFLMIADRLKTMFDKIKTIFNSLSGIVYKVISFIANGISSALSTGVEGVLLFGDKIYQVLSIIFDKVSTFISTFINNLDFKDVFAGLSTGLLAGLFVKISGFIKKLTSMFDKSEEKSGLFDTIRESFDALKDTLASFQQAIKAHAILTIAIAVGILAGSLVALSSIDSEGLNRALAGLTIVFSELIGALFILDSISIGNDSGLYKLAGLMVGMAIAVNILASAVKKLSSLNLEELAKGLGGVGVVLLELAGFLKIADFEKASAKGASSLILMGVALNILAFAVDKFGSIDIEGLAKGLGSIAILLGEFAGFTHLIGDTKGLMSMGVSMIFIASSMVILAQAVKSFGSLGIEELGKGLGTMGVALGIIAGAMRLMPKNTLANGVSLVLVAASINMLVGALGVLGSMSLDSIEQSLEALGMALAMVVVATNGMRQAIPGAIALGVVSAALMLLTPVLLTLGSMSLESIGKSLIALAGAFAVLGLATAILSPIIPAMLGLGAAVALLGVGLGAAGAGIFALAAGLAMLGLGGGALVAGLTSILESLIGLIPTVFTKIGEGIVSLLEVIAVSGDAIAEALTTIISAVLESITKILPQVGELLISALETLCNVVITSAPKIGEAFNALIQLIINILTENIPKIVDLGLFLILSFIQKVSDNIYGISTAAIKIITEFIRAISDNIGQVIDSAINLAISFINGVADGIRNNQQAFKDAIKNLLKSIGDVIAGLGWDLLNFGKDIIRGMIKGVKSMVHNLINAVGGVINDAISAAKKILGIASPSKVFESFGKYSVEGYIIGFVKETGEAKKAVKKTATTIMNNFSDTVSSLRDGIDSDFSITPTISPVIDLTEVTDGVSTIGSMFDSPFGLNIIPTTKLSKYISSTDNDAGFKKTNDSDASNLPNYTFTQYNYSPKALSRIDIYRDTKSQFAMARRSINKR